MRVYVLVKQYNSTEKTVLCGVTFNERESDIWRLGTHENDVYIMEAGELPVAEGQCSVRDQLRAIERHGV